MSSHHQAPQPPISLPRRWVVGRPLFCCILLLLISAPAHAAGSDEVAQVFLWLVVMLVAAKLAGLVERFGQPAVLGELLIGVALGSLDLAGIDVLTPVKTDPVINFLAQLGVVVLLFQIGMESSVESMRKVGRRAALVGIIGVAIRSCSAPISSVRGSCPIRPPSRTCLSARR